MAVKVDGDAAADRDDHTLAARHRLAPLLEMRDDIGGERALLAHRFLTDDEAAAEPILSAVRLISDDNDIAAIGQQRVAAIGAAEFLDRGEDDTADIDLEQLAHLGRAVGLTRRDAQR